MIDPKTMLMSNATMPSIIFPRQWIVFAPPAADSEVESGFDEGDFGDMQGAAKERLQKALEEPDPLLENGIPETIPERLVVDGQVWESRLVEPVLGQVNLRPLLGTPPFGSGVLETPDVTACGKVAYLFIPLESSDEGDTTFGFGADLTIEAWLNGEKICDVKRGGLPFPPTVQDVRCSARVKKGPNLLFIRYVSGKGASILAAGGPLELASNNRHSILTDPLLTHHPSWNAPGLRLAGVSSAEPIPVMGRRELFVDGVLVDQLSPDASLRLHHPAPREVVFRFDRPWEGNFGACFQPISIFRHEGRIFMYYKGANLPGNAEPSTIKYNLRDRSISQNSCLAFSTDGIHFERAKAGHIPYEGSTDNNIVWDGPGYFTPFLDLRPGTPEQQRFKAISGHERRGLGAYVSADGFKWELLSPDPIVTKGAFDSQNLAFWDPVHECYREYHRGSETHGLRKGVRGIMTSTSSDFLDWSEPESLDYEDEFPIHLYTNCIAPCERAPHILLGTPGRMVPGRIKLAGHPDRGVTDTLLIAGRGGKKFHRWRESFLRPSLDPLNWTDRNNFMAWGMVQTSPEEISLYWCEHNGFPSLQLRRGVLRTDGFVSVHAGGAVGEMLTVPFVFEGRKLTLNYATSAWGTIRVELCDVDGTPLPGRGLVDCDLIFGNELEQTVTWNGSSSVGEFSGRPVRMRVRLQDADLFSFQFEKGG